MDLLNRVKSRLSSNNNINSSNGSNGSNGNNSYAPYIIITNFKDTTEKECSKFDYKNEKRYNELLSKAQRARKTIDSTGLSMSLEVPPPPRPSNRDRFMLWRKRNITQHVIPQSEAVVFLTKKGYELNKHYEAYQAIDLAKKIKRDKGIIDNNIEDITLDFSNVYTNKDENILRRHSMYGMHRFNRNVRKFSEGSYMSHSNEFMSPNTRSQSMPNINEYNSFRNRNVMEAGPISISNEFMDIPLQRTYSLNNAETILSSSVHGTSPISPNTIPSAPEHISNNSPNCSNKQEKLYPNCDMD